MTTQPVPKLEDHIRNATVIPSKILIEARKYEFLFLSVHEAQETVGVLVSLQEQLGLEDDSFECVALNRLETSDLNAGGMTIVCCGDESISTIGAKLRSCIDEDISPNYLSEQTWNDNWAMLHVSVRGSFYNRYEFLCSGDLLETPEDLLLSSRSWEQKEFQDKLKGRAFIHDDTTFLQKPFTAESVELPPKSESF